MRVKAVRKGFDGRVRQAGESFEFSGKECPSWCVELDKVKNMKSADMKATEAIALMPSFRTDNEVTAFVKDEERSTVLGAARERKAEILSAE